MKSFLIGLIVLFATSLAYGTDEAARIWGARISTCIQDTDVDTFTTTVDADSASGQKNLYLTSTADLTATDWVVANPGGVREEACYVASVAAGDYVTCTDNLVFTHTAVQGDTVHLTNRLPKTGTGLLPERRYKITCHDATYQGVTCELIFGGPTVDAENVIGESLFGSAIYPATNTYLVHGAGRFVSFFAVDNTIVDVCLWD